MKWRTIAPDLLALTALLALVFIFFWKIALTNLILAGIDSFTFFYPQHDYLARRLASGELPLWNPYLFMGVPFLANPQTQTLYPLNWLFLGFSAPKAVAYSLVLHILLAASFTYLLARKVLGLTIYSAAVAGMVLALGGFLGAQAEHLNLVSSLAWFPLLLLLFYKAEQGGRAYLALCGIVVGLQFLAGQPQGSFITLAALAGWAIYLKWNEGRWAVLRNLARWGGAVIIGVGLAAAQILPTLELSLLSIRGGGLAYRQAASFSLDPRLLLLALLPSLDPSQFSEYIAYSGVVSLFMGIIAIFSGHRYRHLFFFVLLALVSVFLALGFFNPFNFWLYRVVPGFGLFRVPARWLFLFAFSAAMLAGMGVESWRRGEWRMPRISTKPSLRLLAFIGLGMLGLLVQKIPSTTAVLFWVAAGMAAIVILWMGTRPRTKGVAGPLLLAAIVGELFLASRFLAYDRSTAPEAYSSLRTSTLHLLADPGIFRTLSLSSLVFDPGDFGEIQKMFSGSLSSGAIYDYIVATKSKEVLAPNLGLTYGLAMVDGYDGGVLPTGRFVEWERLLLPEEDVSLDGRLWQRLREIPPGRLLNLMNVKYIVADKVQDLWVDGVYYDLGHRAILGDGGAEEVAIHEIPWFPATSLGMISYLDVPALLPVGTKVAEITVADENGEATTYPIHIGEEADEGQGVAQGPSRSRIVGHDPLDPAMRLYHALIPLSEQGSPQEIRIRYLAANGRLVIRGLSLIDGKTGEHQSLVVSTSGDFRLAHSGDVKIYENLDLVPRSFVVHPSRIASNDEEALSMLANPSFDPAQEVVIIGQHQELNLSSPTSPPDDVTITAYYPENVVIEVNLALPGYLVLTDADYPGWKVIVDGEEEQILRADYYFRAVYLDPGRHQIKFLFDPLSWRIGLDISLATGGILALILLWQYRTVTRRGSPASL